MSQWLPMRLEITEIIYTSVRRIRLCQVRPIIDDGPRCYAKSRGSLPAPSRLSTRPGIYGDYFVAELISMTDGRASAGAGGRLRNISPMPQPLGWGVSPISQRSSLG